MTKSITRQIVLASRPHGRPQADNFRLEQLRVLYLSLDPYMRGRMDVRKSYARPVGIGELMPGESVAEVVGSDHPSYAKGDIVLAPAGWRTHAASDGTGLRKLDPALAPVTTGLGVLGMPGFTAYAGLTLLGKPKPGETVVVAAASGPVGSLVGQLAKMASARAVGIAGGPDKCRYVKDELGFDAAIDHRAPDLAMKLAGACANGIDVYVENVGGVIWQAMLPLLNKFARVPVSGPIAQYNGPRAAVEGPHLLAATMREVLSKSLTLRGFIN
jgi:NADPH-dependent curcumin reductase CurA